MTGVDLAAAKSDAFHFEAQARIQGRAHAELDLPAGADDALPGERAAVEVEETRRRSDGGAGSRPQRRRRSSWPRESLGMERMTLRMASDAPAVVLDGFFNGQVLVGEAHEFQADGIDEGVPTGLEDVIADADGGPTAAMIGPFDEDAHLGGSALVGVATRTL